MAIGVPLCVQCGNASNPCRVLEFTCYALGVTFSKAVINICIRCKVVGPTLGFLAFAAAAIVEWPVGALVYLFRHSKGRRIMGHPATVIYPSVTNSIPI